MKQIIALVLWVALMLPATAPQVFAADETSQSGIVDAGNKLCPVMGGPVNGKDFVVYEGKSYGLCCPGCEKLFLADPEKYIAQMEKENASVSEMKATPVAAADVVASEEMEKDMEQGSL